MSQIKDFFINNLRLTTDNNLEDYFAIYKASEFDYFLYFVPAILYKNFLKLFTSILPSVSVSLRGEESKKDSPLQQIFYGAPGTGKSHIIKEKTNGQKVIRTTFHPDSDYSTFVGAYKPTMDDVDIHVVPVVVNNGISLENKGTYQEKRITYKFIKQAFLKAYLGAWKKYSDNQTLQAPQFLIIEEINRGNCAQIFGDIFQLLDRADNGFSEYPIEADSDLRETIRTAFSEEEEYKLSTELQIDDKVENYRSNYDETLSEDVQNGRVLLLPPNLYIWATMNTSDQSLFPIDSAFKRRWDWSYIPIKPHDEENYKIVIGDARYDWWRFLEKINKVIGDTTSSEDKKLGYFFVKAKEDKQIDADKFVGKVLFYLWNDVFKNYGFDHAIFSRGENNKFAFSDFFENDGSPNLNMVKEFLKKLDETIDKEKPFTEAIGTIDAPSSSLMVKYQGGAVEGTSAKDKYVKVVSLVVAEKGADQVALCIGAELTQTPAEGSTRGYMAIGDTGWYLATNNGIVAMKNNLKKIKETLAVDIEIEEGTTE
ncbi:MAG: AAA family ATPase [Bacteroidaceae bacterium]|nr:AAA family ATPase [Bacteroidaceae bacterium]